MRFYEKISIKPLFLAYFDLHKVKIPLACAPGPLRSIPAAWGPALPAARSYTLATCHPCADTRPTIGGKYLNTSSGSWLKL